MYTSIEATDEREGKRSTLPARLERAVDMSPSSLNRLLADTILSSRRFVVYDMRPNVTAEFSDVLITAKVIDADQVLRPYLDGGRRVSESRVRLSVQVKNMYTGENLLSSDSLVEGITGRVSGDRVVITSADDINSPEMQNLLAIDFKNALRRAFVQASLRVEQLLRPLAQVVSAEECNLDLQGGSRHGFQPNDEMIIFRTQLVERGETTVLTRTRAVALVRCASVGVSSSTCKVIKAVPGYRPEVNDYAGITDESLARTRQQ